MSKSKKKDLLVEKEMLLAFLSDSLEMCTEILKYDKKYNDIGDLIMLALEDVLEDVTKEESSKKDDDGELH